jgi:hypothetical protein
MGVQLVVMTSMPYATLAAKAAPQTHRAFKLEQCTSSALSKTVCHGHTPLPLGPYPFGVDSCLCTMYVFVFFNTHLLLQHQVMGVSLC